MHLFLTSEEFVMNGVSYPGIPFLCDKEMEFVLLRQLNNANHTSVMLVML